MENVIWVAVMILLALPALTILIPIVLIDNLIRLLHHAVSRLSGKRDDFVRDAYLNDRPEHYG